MRLFVIALAMLLLAAGLAGTASADAISLAYGGPGVSLSGTFFGSNNGNGSWTITGINATYNFTQVTDIVATGLDPHFLYNNLYYDSRFRTFAVDYYGIVFNVPGLGDINLCTDNGSGGCGSGGYASILWDGSNYQYTQLNQSGAGPAVPEPSTLALLGGGLAAAGMIARRVLRR